MKSDGNVSTMAEYLTIVLSIWSKHLSWNQGPSDNVGALGSVHTVLGILLRYKIEQNQKVLKADLIFKIFS